MISCGSFRPFAVFSPTAALGQHLLVIVPQHTVLCGILCPFAVSPSLRPSAIILHTATMTFEQCSPFAVYPHATARGSIRPSRVFPRMSTYGSIHLPFHSLRLSAASCPGSVCSFFLHTVVCGSSRYFLQSSRTQLLVAVFVV